MSVNKPTDYIYQDVPRSTAEAVQQTAYEESLVLVKSAVQRYINYFFSKDGKYRPLVESVCPSINQFATDVRLPRPDDCRE